MQSLSVFERNALSVLLVLSFLGVSREALADAKKECSAAYDQTQALRRQGKLQAAAQQAAACTRDACAAFIRTDCTKWIGEIEQSQPTVVIEVLDAHGQDTRAVHIVLDGNPWLDALDGAAKPIDPGQHTLHYVADGQAPIDDTVQIREGEKNRKLSVSFAKTVPPPIAPTASPSQSQPDAPSTVAPWVIGGVGVAALVVGAVTGGLVLHDKSTANAECNATKKCSPAGFSAVKQGRVLGPVTTTALVVGGLAVGVGVTWLVVRSTAKKPSAPPTAAMTMGPSFNATGAAWRIEGIW